MASYMYPTQAERRKGNVDEWVRGMLDEWEKSEKRYLCFPYARMRDKKNFPNYIVNHTNENESFWLYVYYRKPYSGKDYVMGGQVRFRIHVCGRRAKDYELSTDKKERHNTSNVHLLDNFPNMEVTIRFVCDEFEEICLVNGKPVRIENFRHPMDKSLPHLMRNQYVGIPPVECLVEERIKVIHSYNKQGQKLPLTIH